MMAARAILDHRVGGEGLVSACESYLPMVKLMRRVLRANGMEKMVKVFPKRPRNFKSEGFGFSCLYADIVSDGICLTPVALETLIQVKPQQYALHVNPLFNEMHLLSEPFKIFEFDFWKRPDSHGETEILVTPTVDGRVNAVVSWWVLQLDCDGSVFYSTAPNWIVTSGNEDHWCDHWKQCVWFIPGKGISVSRNANILLKAVHDDSHVSYSLRADKEACHNLFNFDECHLFLPPERIALYGTKEVRSAWLTAIKNAVIADDSLLLTILAASLSKTSEVISSFHGLQRKGYKYLQAVSTANNFSMDRILVLVKRVPSLLLEDNQREVDLFIAEPFYYGNDGMLPWHNLRFWKDKCMLDPILSKDAIIMPCKGLLRVCAMHLPELSEVFYSWNLFSEPMQSCFQKVKGAMLFVNPWNENSIIIPFVMFPSDAMVIVVGGVGS
ncbi:hypothetical protein HPP92_028199 [Vanilla planifolia]|uniref:Protein arginine N-methyltransferase domain-containing protein n=1 Tax=Vanilla planifolia TaxID=51239 RepID=A0A835P919_VANPL|nr:hypothetical protein HPP92_028199 [Vanilla planifolia]